MPVQTASPRRTKLKNPALRPIGASDADALRDLYACSLRQNPAGFVQDPLRHGDIFARAEQYRQEDGAMLGLFSAEEALIGFGGLQKKDARVCELCNLHLRPDFQGLGLGRYLAEYLVGLARALGYAVVRLHVTATQERAIHLYRRLGFIETKRQVYEVAGQEFDTLFMELAL